jgi:hypothetical protein
LCWGGWRGSLCGSTETRRRRKGVVGWSNVQKKKKKTVQVCKLEGFRRCNIE